MRVRPSPERLQLQIRSLVKSHDELKASVSEEREIIADSCKQMTDTVRRVLDSKLDSQYEQYREMNKKVTEVCSTNNQLLEQMSEIQRSLTRNQVSE